MILCWPFISACFWEYLSGLLRAILKYLTTLYYLASVTVLTNCNHLATLYYLATVAATICNCKCTY